VTPEAQRAHLQHVADWQAAGKIVAAGQIKDDGEIRGIFVFATDAAEAQRFVAEDPHAKAGKRTMDLFTWWCADHVMPAPEGQREK
jgi:uncharacterized protein YciI